jgi:signal transduction histidine kinase
MSINSWGSRFLARLGPPDRIDSVSHSEWSRIAVIAIVVAMPLWAFGALILGWIDADEVATRRIVQENARADAQRLEAAALAALDKKSREEFERIKFIRQQGDSTLQLRLLIYSGEFSYLLIRRGTELVFPLDGEWGLPNIEVERRHQLSAAADLYSRAQPPQAWYGGLSGAIFFRCDRKENEDVCFAIDETALRPDITASLATAAKQAPEWAFRLRDPYNRVFWDNGQGSLGYPFTFELTGALRGWALDIGDMKEPGRTNIAQSLTLSLPLALFWVFFVWSLAKRQSEKLSQMNAKKAFLAKIAHDLRTPLSNLKLYCELVSQQSEGNAVAEDHCAVLAAEIDRLDQIAANAMTFGGSRAPQTSKAKPDDIVQGRLESFDRRLTACKSVCTIEASETKTLVFDVGAFERILVNLLDNACKYAVGAISVATMYEDGFLRLEVRDHGPGLDSDQAGGPRESGLGLDIVRDLARANGGHVSLINGLSGLRVIVTLKAHPAE